MEPKDKERVDREEIRKVAQDYLAQMPILYDKAGFGGLAGELQVNPLDPVQLAAFVTAYHSFLEGEEQIDLIIMPESPIYEGYASAIWECASQTLLAATEWVKKEFGEDAALALEGELDKLGAP